MKCSRRNFLLGTSASVFLTGINFPAKALVDKKKNLIVITLRGGMDGLSAVPVISDKSIRKLRKELIIQKSLKLNSDFALHPSLDALYNLWEKNKATIVHATNIPYTGRSHFDGQNLMESGGLIPYKEKTGWLGRGMLSAGYEGKGLALALPMPLLLRGVPRNDNYFPAKGKLPSQTVIDILSDAYVQKNETNLQQILDIISKRPISMMAGGGYGKRNHAALAKETAKLLKKDDGPSIAVFDLNGFDTHTAQGGEEGDLAEQLDDVNQIIKIISSNMGDAFENTLIITLTEFGRTIKQNGGYGTEHGYGSAILMAGGLLKKSQVYTDWPGLKKKNLFEGRDLQSTIDARAIYNSAMATCFNTDPKQLNRDVFWSEDMPDLTDTLFKV